MTQKEMVQLAEYYLRKNLDEQGVKIIEDPDEVRRLLAEQQAK